MKATEEGVVRIGANNEKVWDVHFQAFVRQDESQMCGCRWGLDQRPVKQCKKAPVVSDEALGRLFDSVSGKLDEMKRTSVVVFRAM